MKATGMSANAVLITAIKAVDDKIDQIPTLVSRQVSDVIEENGVAAGNITNGQILSSINTAVSAVLEGRLNDIQRAAQQPPEAAPPPSALLHHWGGRLAKVRPLYRFIVV